MAASARPQAAFSPLSGAGGNGKKTNVRGQRKSAALRPQSRRPRTRKRTAAELSNPPRCRRCSRRPSTTRRRGSARLAPSRSKLPSQPRALSGTPCASARRRSPPRRRWKASLLFTASPVKRRRWRAPRHRCRRVSLLASAASGTVRPPVKDTHSPRLMSPVHSHFLNESASGSRAAHASTSRLERT